MLRLLPMIVIGIIAVSGCQTRYYDQGKGPLSLSKEAVALLEKYESYSTPGAFAVTADGRKGGYMYCSSSYCSSALANEAINICESFHNRDCKVFAIERDIVWDGPISYAKLAPDTYNFVFTMERGGGTGYHVNYRGEAIEIENGKKLSLTAKVRTMDCGGLADIRAKTWTLLCEGAVRYAGKLSSGYDAKYGGDGTGPSGDSVEVRILERSVILSGL